MFNKKKDGLDVTIYPNSQGRPIVSVSGTNPEEVANAYLRVVQTLGITAGKKANKKVVKKEEVKNVANNG